MVTTLPQAAVPVRYTVDDLDQFPDDGKLRELVNGQIVEWDVTTEYHGWLLVALGRMLGTFVLQHRLGLVVGGDPLVMIQGSRHDARGPDVAFYVRSRIPKDLKRSAADVAPDFVIEILSPSDRAAAVQEKVLDWLRAGVRLLWYVNPETGLTTVYHDGRVSGVTADETLDGADVVPGFSVRLRDLYDELDALLAPEE